MVTARGAGGHPLPQWPGKDRDDRRLRAHPLRLHGGGGYRFCTVGAARGDTVGGAGTVGWRICRRGSINVSWPVIYRLVRVCNRLGQERYCKEPIAVLEQVVGDPDTYLRMRVTQPHYKVFQAPCSGRAYCHQW